MAVLYEGIKQRQSLFRLVLLLVPPAASPADDSSVSLFPLLLVIPLSFVVVVFVFVVVVIVASWSFQLDLRELLEPEGDCHSTS